MEHTRFIGLAAIIVVEDDSADGTWNGLAGLADGNSHIVAFRLSRKHGRQLDLTSLAPPTLRPANGGRARRSRRRSRVDAPALPEYKRSQVLGPLSDADLN
jgi:hypothetical protein